MKNISRNTKRKNKQYRKKRHLRTRKLQSYIVAMGGNGEEEEDGGRLSYTDFLYSLLDSIGRLKVFKEELAAEKKETKKKETKKTINEIEKKINDEKNYIKTVSESSPEEFKKVNIEYNNINMTPIEYIFENIDDSNLVGTLSTYYTINEEIAQRILTSPSIKKHNKDALLKEFPQYKELKKEPSPPKLPDETDNILPPQPPPPPKSDKKRNKKSKTNNAHSPTKIIPEEIRVIDASPEKTSTQTTELTILPPSENSRKPPLHPPPPPSHRPQSSTTHSQHHNNPIADVMKEVQEILREGFQNQIKDLNRLRDIEMCQIVESILPTYKASINTQYTENGKLFNDTPQDVYEYNMLLCSIFIILGIITPFFNQNPDSHYKIIIKGGKATQFLLHEFRTKKIPEYITNDIDFLVVPKDGIDYNFYEIKYIAAYISNIINQFLNVGNKISILIPDNPEYIKNPRINPYVIKISYSKSSRTGFRALCDIGFDEIKDEVSDFFTSNQMFMTTVNNLDLPETKVLYEYPTLESVFREKIYYTILYNNNTTKNEHEIKTQEKFAKTVLLLVSVMPNSGDYKGKKPLQIIRDAVDSLSSKIKDTNNVMNYFGTF